MNQAIIVISATLLFISPLISFFLYTEGYFWPDIYTTQEVQLESVLKNKYSVNTYVWVKYKGELTIEKSYTKGDATCEQIPLAKQIQMELAQQIVEQVKERLKTFELCANL